MTATRSLVFAIVITSTVMAHASSLTVKVRAHSTLIEEGGVRHSAYAVFTDERLVTEVQLDVYKLPQLPSTADHYADLQKLSLTTWLDRVRWSLVAEDGTAIALPTPHIVANSVRHRGPNAELPRDRDATVECATYSAILDFGPLRTGNYTLSSTIEGIDSTYRFDVKTGRESGWRDVYLHNQATHAKTYAEYRQLTLERLRESPDRLDIVLDLIDRSLEHGTLEETRSYISRAADIVEQRSHRSGSAADSRQSIAYLRDFERELPEYFLHRADGKVVRDTATGRHVIRSRATGKIVKEVGVMDR